MREAQLMTLAVENTGIAVSIDAGEADDVHPRDKRLIGHRLALKALGYDDESPELIECYKQLEDLVIEDDSTGTARLQPCKSPVWDTALSLNALGIMCPSLLMMGQRSRSGLGICLMPY